MAASTQKRPKSGSYLGTSEGAQGKWQCRLPGSSQARARPRRCASGPLIPVCSCRVVLSLKIVAINSFTNLAPLSLRKHSTIPPTSARNFVVAVATSITSAPEGAEPSHVRRVILEQDQAQGPPSTRYFPGAGKVNENTLQGLGHPRESRRRHRRTPTLLLHASTVGLSSVPVSLM